MDNQIYHLTDIAIAVGGAIVGNDSIAVYGVAKIEEAGPADLSFIASPKYAKYLDATRAGALLVPADLDRTRSDITYIVVDNPQRAFRSLLSRFAPPLDLPGAGIHPTAIIGDDTVVGDGVRIGAHVMIGNNCALGAGVSLGSNVVVGRDVSIGDGTIVYANVTVYHGTIIGCRCILHAGSVLGSDGLGFEPTDGGAWEKTPQIGIVVLGDDVEIGANTTIDRATVGRTDIGHGVKIDNLVHIAHNVVIGRDSIVAAQAGIAGSSKLGVRNMVAGQVGIVGHIDTCDDVIIEAGSGVSKSLRKPGRYFGHPAKEHSVALRQEGALRQLPDLLAEIREINRRLSRLESMDSFTG